MKNELDYIAGRIEKYISDTKKITATPGQGVTRLPFTLESKRCVHYLEEKMKNMGLAVTEDASGAIIGILEGKSEQRIMIGSHYDSVEHGGAYDGMAGILCGLEIAAYYIRNQMIPPYTLEIAGLNDEEGDRFGGGYLSSKAFLGKWTTNDLKYYIDKHGISYYDAMILYGYAPEHLMRAERPRKGWKGYLEIHVEQGPIMESQGIEIGIVETIVAIQRYYITIVGKADHAGTQPMDTRSDAVMAAMDVITNMRKYVLKHKGMVGTVGEIHVYPNEINIVPEKITFSIDVRSADQEWLDECVHQISEDIKKKEMKGFTCEMKPTLTNTVTAMKEEWVKGLEKSADRLGFSNMRINSGAGHDAAIIGKEVDTAMLFVPSVGGRSHIPEEYSDERDLAKAVLTAIDFIDHIDEERKSE
ncbi:MAG: M20 family metallo-hydrolase [Lachnospiraceae bacterium]|nr:M20 family metallo-hydrolase [Lachnospiraceae bacterium]